MVCSGVEAVEVVSMNKAKTSAKAACNNNFSRVIQLSILMDLFSLRHFYQLISLDLDLRLRSEPLLKLTMFSAVILEHFPGIIEFFLSG